MDKRILLVNTSFPRNPDRKYSAFGFPLGLMQIEASLRRAGYCPYFVDPQTHVNHESMILNILSKKPVFVGMSTYLGENLINAMEISAKIRAVNPAIPIVWGGPFASSAPEICFEQAEVDYVVMGMGEDSAVKLANYLSIADSVLDTTNICFKRDGKISLGTLYRFYGELDNLPLPDLRLWEVGVRRMQAIPIMSSRGCPRRCNFCYNSFVTKSKYLLRSPESVLAEMNRWAVYFDIREFHFVDDNFLIDPKRSAVILNAVRDRGWKISRLMAHLNDFRDEIMPLLHATTRSVIMCIESASPRMQKMLNKCLDLEKALELIKTLSHQSIGFTTAFMFGLPTETDDDIRASVEMASRIRDINGKNLCMCYIYAPQPQDMIVNGNGLRGKIDFSLAVVGNVEVIPVFPNNKIELRLRPWMSEEDRTFYLDFVPVWFSHFGMKRDRRLTAGQVGEVYARSPRIRRLFEGINLPVH